MMNISLLPRWSTTYVFAFLFLTAFCIRALAFYFYIQEKERYRQPDTMDYYVSSAMLATSNTFYNPYTKRPIFWRTPGYPAYLALFFKLFGVNGFKLKDNDMVNKIALWMQIFLSSMIPILAFLLAHTLTGSRTIAWLVGLIFTVHLGFVLASCYLLTEALAMIFFFIFLIFLYRSFYVYAEDTRKLSLYYPIGAALSLAIYTWMRPNGIFIALFSMLFFILAHESWRNKIIKIFLFLGIFFACLAPWNIRNYNLTGKWFFWPGSGPYLISFCAPKIARRLIQKPLNECINLVYSDLNKEIATQEQLQSMRSKYDRKVVVHEIICHQQAMPWITKYPYYFMLDWLREVNKTTFDLYASQLVAFANNTYTYDPLEEFLSEKLKLCIYKQPMHWFMRTMCITELFFSILLWIGIICGFIIFLIKPFIAYLRKKEMDQIVISRALLWFKLGPMIGALLIMTGGFGYARLRMGAEPLLIILSLTWWLWLLYHTFDTQKNCNKEMHIP